MIPDDVLRALGLLSVRFNELEEVLSLMLAWLIGADDGRLAYRYFAPMDFSMKRSGIRRLCALQREEGGFLANDQEVLNSIEQFTEQCDGAARTRNLYLHAVSSFHVQEGKFMLSSPKSGASIDANPDRIYEGCAKIETSLNDGMRLLEDIQKAWLNEKSSKHPTTIPFTTNPA